MRMFGEILFFLIILLFHKFTNISYDIIILIFIIDIWIDDAKKNN